MKMVRLNIQHPLTLKAKLDVLRVRDTIASGLIRTMLDRELKRVPSGKIGR